MKNLFISLLLCLALPAYSFICGETTMINPAESGDKVIHIKEV